MSLSDFEKVKEQIKERSDLAAVVGRHAKLHKSSSGFKACCPLPGHSEKTPSFHVNTRENYFYCYGCQRGGDIFKFLELVEGLPFIEAMKELAGTLGIEMPQSSNLSADGKKVVLQRKALHERGLDLLKRCASFYLRCLKDSQTQGAKRARSYLKERGLSQAFAEELQLGWAPENATALAGRLRENADIDLAKDLGLLHSFRGGELGDMFSGRLMIPIRDHRGRVLAFSGRSLDPVSANNPKYKNSKESDWFKKKEILYGLFEASTLIRNRGFVVIVEGFFDQWAFQRRDVPSVAVMGTALSAAHADILSRYTKEVILLLDNDAAGIESTKRAIPLLLSKDFDVKVFDALEHKDPDEWLAQKVPILVDNEIEGQLKSAPEALEWWVKQEVVSGQASQKTRLQTLRDLLPVWALAKDAAHKSLIAESISLHLGISASDVRSTLDGRQFSQRPALSLAQPSIEEPLHGGGSSQQARGVPNIAVSRQERLAEELLYLGLSYWSVLAPKSHSDWQEWEELFSASFAEALLQSLGAEAAREVSVELSRAKLRSLLENEDSHPLLRKTLFRVLGSESPEVQRGPDEIQKIRSAWKELALILHRENCQRQLKSLQIRLRQVPSESPEQAELLKRIQELRFGLEKRK